MSFVSQHFKVASSPIMEDYTAQFLKIIEKKKKREKSSADLEYVRAAYVYIEKESMHIIRFAIHKGRWFDADAFDPRDSKLFPNLHFMMNLVNRAIRTVNIMQNALTLKPEDTTTMYLRIWLRTLNPNPQWRSKVESASDAHVVEFAKVKIDSECAIQKATAKVLDAAFTQHYRQRKGYIDRAIVSDEDAALMPKRASELQMADKNIVLAAVKHNPEAIRFASKELKNDKDVAMEVVKNSLGHLGFVGPLMKADRDVVMAAVRHYPGALRSAADVLKADRGIVMAAVKHRFGNRALQLAAPALRADRELVLVAVQHCGKALHYAAAALKTDRDLVLAAINNDGMALQYADETFKADRELVLVAVQHCGMALKYADKLLKADRGIVLAAVENDGLALIYADKTLTTDRGIVLAAVENDGMALRYADVSFRADQTIVETAVKQNRRALFFNPTLTFAKT